MESIECFNKNIINQPFKISLMTVCCTFKKIIDLTIFLNYEGVSYDPTKKKNDKKNESDKKNAKKEHFYNSLRLNLKIDDNNISIKFFRNGSIHIAGSKTIEAVYKVISYIEKLSEMQIYDPRIVMLNSNFDLKEIINLESLSNSINKNNKNPNFGMALYNHEQFPGIKIKYLEHVYIFVFKSGKISIMAAKNSETMLSAYNEFMILFRNHV